MNDLAEIEPKKDESSFKYHLGIGLMWFLILVGLGTCQKLTSDGGSKSLISIEKDCEK